MKRIKTQTNINQLWQPLPERTQEVIRGGDRPAGGGGDCPPIFDTIDSAASSGGTGIVVPVKIKHGL